jgi:hypothetical protein
MTAMEASMIATLAAISILFATWDPLASAMFYSILAHRSVILNLPIMNGSRACVRLADSKRGPARAFGNKSAKGRDFDA